MRTRKSLGRRFGVATLAAWAGLALAGGAHGVAIPEAEPNESKPAATPVTMACGDTLNGTSTGSSTAPGAGSVDYWRITTPAGAPGVYKYTLTLASTPAGHTATVRGLNQVGGVIGATDSILQTARVSGADRVSTFYGFGAPGQLYYAVFGTAATTAPYSVALACAPVAFVDVAGTVTAGPVTIQPDANTFVDLDWWVYDSNFTPVANGGRDEPQIPGPSLTLTPGTYYLAYGQGNTANNQAAAAATGETFTSGNVADFSGVVVTNSTFSFPGAMNVQIVSAAGTRTASAVTPPTHEIVWYRFTVSPATFPTAVASASPSPARRGLPATLTLTVTPAQGSSLANITGVTGNVAAVSGNAGDTAVAFARVGATDQWSYTIPAVNGTTGPKTVSYTITDPLAPGGNGTGSFPLSVVPANDVCASALPIVAGSFVVGSNVGATNESPAPPACGGLNAQYNLGLWYTFTEGASARRLTATTCDPFTNYNTRVYVYAGACGALSCVNANAVATPACPDRADAAAATFCTSPGQTYSILVTNDTTGTGDFALLLNDTGLGCTAPSNDACAGATELTLVASTPVPFGADNTFGATTDAIDVGACNVTSAATNGVWYRFVAPGNGVVQFAESSAQDVATGVWRFEAGAFACPSAGPSTIPCSNAENFSFDVLAGRTYLLLVHADSTAQPTVGVAGTLTFLPSPQNEDCASATALPVPGTFVLANVGSQNAPSANASVACPTTVQTMSNDVWYKWTAGAEGTVALMPRSFPNAFSGRIALYDGGPSPGACPNPGDAPLACNAFSATGVTTPVPTGSVTAGHVYYLQMSSQAAGSTGTATVDIDFAPAAVGRCCTGSACALLTSGACAASGGTYGGDNTLCSAATGQTDTFAGPGGFIGDPVGTAEGFLSLPVTVTDAGFVSDLEVDLVWSTGHTYATDTIITLSNGSRQIALSNRPRRGQTAFGGGASNFVSNETYTFADAGTDSLDGLLATDPGATFPSGVYRPGGVQGVSYGLRNTFNGAPLAGTWTLQIRDHAGGDTGTVASWTLRVARGAAPPCTPSTVVCCRGSTCATVAADSCTLAGAPSAGVFNAGAGSACNTAVNNTTPCCKADYNKVGNVELLDIFAFLQDWFGNVPYADFNGQSNVDLLDIFAFLQAWFNGAC